MAYYGPNGNFSNFGRGRGSNNNMGGGGWRMGDGGRYMYGRGAGIHGAAVASVHGGNQWGAGDEVTPSWVVSVIRQDTFDAAEVAAEEVLARLHPTTAAEKRRHEIINYAKNLIGTYFGCQVYAFGSVPLKTYLPDGDIDMTVQANTSLDATFIDQVRCLLMSEQHNADCPFRLHSMRFIDAEVKLIKCAIDNITVDISFNQFGGVSTLCFLELVDSRVGKQHLFKRSIMLIKTWCFNECNILGANQWLLSTYALEILVLHIFNVFYRSLNGPLEALFKFLEYYRNFDWDRYGLSLDGPVPLSFFRKFNAAQSNAAKNELLLCMEPLRSSFDRLLQLPADAVIPDTNFRVKFMNIIDPLKSSNNLGRSVSEDNYHRIRNAFACGAHKLGEVLLLHSPESVPNEIYRLFEKTLKSYGRGERQDLVTGPLLQLPRQELSWSSGTSSRNEYGSSSTEDALELTDKEAQVTPPAENGGSSSNSNGKPELLNLTGNLGKHLGCLRNVQYNLEALFDELQNRVKQSSDAGLLDEEKLRKNMSENPSGSQAAPNRCSSSSSQPPVPNTPAVVVPSGISTYFTRPPRWHRHVQRGAGEGYRSQAPAERQTTSTQQQAPSRAAYFRRRASTGGRVWKAMSSQPRADDGSSSSSQPAVPNHGDHTEGIHLAMAATSICGESSSPAAADAGEPSTPPAAAGAEPAVTTGGELSTPAVTTGGESSTPTVDAAVECSKVAATGKDLKWEIEEGKLEFGSLGPLSPTLFTPKFIQDFPPLPATKRPTAPTLKISWPAQAPSGSAQKLPGPSAAHNGKTEESPAPTVRSPKHGPAAAQTRPEAYRLKDEADFPPLHKGTR